MPQLSQEERQRRAEAYARELGAIARRLRLEREEMAQGLILPEPLPPAETRKPRPSYPRRCTMSKRHGRGPLARPALEDGQHAPGVARGMKSRLELRIAAERTGRLLQNSTS